MIAQELFDKYKETAITIKMTEGIITKDNFIKAIGEIISLPVEAQVSDDFAGLYWKHRCEAAEIFIAKSPCDPDITEGQIKAYAYWKKLCDIKPKDYNK